MGFRTKLVTVITVLVVVAGDVSAVKADASGSAPSFNSNQCAPWTKDNFSFQPDAEPSKDDPGQYVVFSKIDSFSMDDQLLVGKKYLCFPDEDFNFEKPIKIGDNFLENRPIFEIRRWPEALVGIPRNFGFYGLKKIPKKWPDNVTRIEEQAFSSANLQKIPDRWPKGLTYIGHNAFHQNSWDVLFKNPAMMQAFDGYGIANDSFNRLPDEWPVSMETIGQGAFQENAITCLANVNSKNFLSTLQEQENVFDEKALANGGCKSSYSDVTVKRGVGSSVSQFVAGPIGEKPSSFYSCEVKETVDGVTFTPVGVQGCNFEVSADEKAELGTHPVDVEITPSTGKPYRAPLSFTVIEPEEEGEVTAVEDEEEGEVTVVEDEKEDAHPVGNGGNSILGVVGGLLLLKMGLIGSLYLAVPGDGRDLILKRQLMGAGMPECLADPVSAVMWKFHKLTGTPMGEEGDTDNDGLTDLEEREGKRNTAFGMRATNPFAADTDGDGTNDGFEIARGTDPNVKN